MNALGSPNVYTHGAACNMSKNAGFTQVIGTGDFTSDVANSKMTMFIGRSYADAIKPSQLHAMQKAHENGAELVIVDPRLNNSIAFADEWVPINPGTDLAFILAMAHVIVHNKLYDASYIAENTVGFEEWADYLKDCTPARDSGYSSAPAILPSGLGTGGNFSLSRLPAFTELPKKAPPSWFQQPRSVLKQHTARAVSPEFA